MILKKIGVVGSGIMGSGISQVVLQAGYDVTVYDINEKMVDKGLSYIKKNFDKDAAKGKKSQEFIDGIIKNIKITTNIEDLKEMDAVFEVITEKIAMKEELLKKLSGVCNDNTIFITNTSSISITKMAAFTNRPDKYIGMHFFNPVPVMNLVEITRGYYTSDETYFAAVEIAKKIGKESITVKDSPLFTVNRILVPMMNEAIFALGEGISTREDIDKGLVIGANHPIGPLALADLCGLETVLSVLESLYDQTKDSKYRPAPLLVKMVEAGRYGRKNGKGFYDYEN